MRFQDPETKNPRGLGGGLTATSAVTRLRVATSKSGRILDAFASAVNTAAQRSTLPYRPPSVRRVNLPLVGPVQFRLAEKVTTSG